MNVDEILAVKIPDGKYKLAMIFIRNRTSSFSKCETGFTEDQLCDSLCASFEALYVMAMNETAAGCMKLHEAKQRAFDAKVSFIIKQTRTKALDEALGVVNGERLKNRTVNGHFYPDTLERIKSRIERMKGEGGNG